MKIKSKIFIPLLYFSHSEATRDVKVHIENVKTITLHRGELTNGRRNTPIDQMRCVGGDACHRYSPDVIQCTNTGSDGLDVNWRCNAELPDYLKFGPLTVNCEGYNYPDDPYILQGSCGLEYTLYYKDISKQDRSYQWFQEKEYIIYDHSHDSIYDKLLNFKNSELFSSLFSIAWISLVIFILYKIYKSNLRTYNNRSQNFWPGGGGGFYPRDDSFYQNSYSSQNFWTGLGMGSLAGYFFGRNYSSSQPRTYFMQPTRFRTTFTSSSSSSSNMTNSQGFGRTKRR